MQGQRYASMRTSIQGKRKFKVASVVSSGSACAREPAHFRVEVACLQEFVGICSFIYWLLV